MDSAGTGDRGAVLDQADPLMSRLPPSITSRLRVPLIVAPMFRVSGFDLVAAACAAGAIGAFPAINARSVETLDQWLTSLELAAAEAGHPVAPHCPNLIMAQPGLAEYLDCLVRHRVELVITSVGSPVPVIESLHEAGTLVLADVATVNHARKAIAAGVDGLVLLTAGAGGNTGWLNPFAFVRAVRGFYDGPIVLAGGIADGTALHAARALGCDLAYMGTRFIASEESTASPEHKSMLVASDADDILLTKALSGMPMSILRPSVLAAGLDPSRLDEQIQPADADKLYGGKSDTPGPKRWVDIYSAGHSVSVVDTVRSAGELIEDIAAEYADTARRYSPT